MIIKDLMHGIYKIILFSVPKVSRLSVSSKNFKSQFKMWKSHHAIKLQFTKWTTSLNWITIFKRNHLHHWMQDKSRNAKSDTTCPNSSINRQKLRSGDQGHVMQDLYLSIQLFKILLIILTWTPFTFKKWILQQYLEGVSTWSSVVNNMRKYVQYPENKNIANLSPKKKNTI